MPPSVGVDEARAGGKFRAMAQRDAVEVRVAGVSLRVRTSASHEELAALASLVEDRLGRSARSKAPATTRELALAALALAGELSEERARRVALEARASAVVGRAVRRLDELLGPEDAAP